VVTAQAGATQLSSLEQSEEEALLRSLKPPGHLLTRAERRRMLKSQSPTPENFARFVPSRSASEAPWRYIQLGDGWGCGKHADDSYECWSVARDANSESAIVARSVPWLDGKDFSVGPDRLCVYEGNASTSDEIAQWRCWRAPEFLERAPEKALAPDNEHWIVSADPFSRDKFVHDTMPVEHGAAVGCAGGFCWGSTSALLPKPMCEADGLRLPCALVDEATLRKFADNDTALSSGEEFIVGDLFACRGFAETGLYCVGASRDGLFGTPSACPPGLDSAWPSSSGPMAAPRAACAPSPVLVARAGRYSGVFGSASPNGFCLSVHRDDDWFPLCFGGIAAPKPGLTNIVLGLSDQPSLCGLDQAGQLYCWGEGYSRDAARKVPVRIHRSPAHPSVARDDKDPILRKCLIRENCGRTVRRLPACSPESDGLDPSTLIALADGFEGKRVSVRGNLKLTPVIPPYYGVNCMPDQLASGNCCSGFGEASVLVTNGDENVILDGSWCHGDSSRLCCSFPVLGQAVIVSGVFSWRHSRWLTPEAWVIKEAEVCEVQADPPFTRLDATSWPAPSLSLR